MSDTTVPDKVVINRDENGKFLPGTLANPAGRPKRKTLTELIHDKLDKTPNGWEELVDLILLMAKRKDKDILKELWHYTDGMPNQKQEITGKDGKDLFPQPIVGGLSTKNETPA